MDIEARLKDLGITLPAPPPPVAAYVPFTIAGRQLFIAGQLPLENGALVHAGRLGESVSLEDGQAAARLCAINILAQAKAAAGDLGRLGQCLKLGVFVSAAADFTQHAQVADGASQLIAAVLGEAGRHARSSVGVSSLPRGAAVEADAVFELA